MFQTSRIIRLLFLCMGAFILLLGNQHAINAQSQALNGQIEGAVIDATGATVPNAPVTVRNIETGTERQVTSDENGVYRAPLLPLGTSE